MLNHAVVQLHSSYPYLISMLQKSQIKKLLFIEHHNSCTMISITRKDCKLISDISFNVVLYVKYNIRLKVLTYRYLCDYK